MEIVTSPNFKIHLEAFPDIVKVQKGVNRGIYLIFLDRSFIKKQMQTSDMFYKEAL